MSLVHSFCLKAKTGLHCSVDSFEKKLAESRIISGVIEKTDISENFFKTLNPALLNIALFPKSRQAGRVFSG